MGGVFPRRMTIHFYFLNNHFRSLLGIRLGFWWCAGCLFLLGFGFLCIADFFGFVGEFDPGSGRTLAACLTHASRTVKQELAFVDQWRTGE